MGRGPKLNELVPVDATAAWQTKMRAAAFGELKESDVKEIVAGIVKKAKTGDPQACRMVFEYLLGGKGGPTTVNNVQINCDSPPPIEATDAAPGTPEKLRVMRERIASGRGAFRDDDGRRDAC